MLLVLDMGNTNITLGVYDGDRLVMQARLATDRKKLADQYAVELMMLLRLHGVDGTAFTGAILSSVVPPLNRVLTAAVKKVTGITPMSVGPGTKTGINIRIDNPATLGADLLVGAVAAVERVGYPCLIWDLGTATTASVVDKNGAYIGVAIMPGVRTSLNSLTEGTSLLPSISLDAPAKAIGTNTIASLQSGVVYGTAAMIDGMSARFFEELGYTAPIVMTGGIAADILPQCHSDILYVDELLLDGLRLIYEKNRK